jgi:O-glycosyl hydrolase
MLRTRSAIALVALVAGCGKSTAADTTSTTGGTPAVTPDATITVDAAAPHQTIQGFGATLTTFEDAGIFKRHDPAQPAVTSATDVQKTALAKQLHQQIGITRTRVFPAAFEPVNDNDDPFTLAPAGFDWAGTDAIIAWLQLAKPTGLTTYFASFGANGGTDGEAWLRLPKDACAIDTAKLDEYVEWELAAALHFHAKGVDLPFLTMGNEADFCPVQGNASPYLLNPSHYALAVKKLGARLAKSGLPAKIVITDGVTPGSSLPYFNAVLEDAEARSYVGALAFHSYDGYQSLEKLDESAAGKPIGQEPRAALRTLAKKYSLPLWMTEVCYCAPQKRGAQ